MLSSLFWDPLKNLKLSSKKRKSDGQKSFMTKMGIANMSSAKYFIK